MRRHAASRWPLLATAVLLLALEPPAESNTARPGTVRSYQKISSTEGHFTGAIASFDHFSWGLASPGDLNRDGVPDLVVGAYADDDGGPDRGALWVLFLNSDGTVKTQQKISSVAGGFRGRLADRDVFGWAVASLGDLDADGTSDLAVGARGDDDGGDATGAVWILFLNPDGTVKRQQKISGKPLATGLRRVTQWLAGDAPSGFAGPLRQGDEFGVSVAGVGDLDGDGTPDLAVGSRLDQDGGKNRGAVWILFLKPDGTVKGAQKISSTQGKFGGALADEDEFGFSLAPLGDLNGDGVPDLAAGARYADDGGQDRGAVWILFLNRDGTVRAQQKISDSEGNFTGILRNQNEFGAALASVGDLDADGVTDLAVGARRDSDGGLSRGATWVLFLNKDGTVKTQQKISTFEGQFFGALDNNDWFGSSLAALGALKPDGSRAVAVSAEGDDDGGDMRGAVWILFLEAGAR
jgi:FG-GAP repeat protein